MNTLQFTETANTRRVLWKREGGGGGTDGRCKWFGMGRWVEGFCMYWCVELLINISQPSGDSSDSACLIQGIVWVWIFFCLLIWYLFLFVWRLFLRTIQFDRRHNWRLSKIWKVVWTQCVKTNASASRAGLSFPSQYQLYSLHLGVVKRIWSHIHVFSWCHLPFQVSFSWNISLSPHSEYLSV